MRHKIHLHGLTLHSEYHLSACHQRLIGNWKPRATKNTKKVNCKRCRAYVKDKFRIYVASVWNCRGKLVHRWRIFASDVWLVEKFLRDMNKIPRRGKVTTRLYRGKNTGGIVTAE